MFLFFSLDIMIYFKSLNYFRTALEFSRRIAAVVVSSAMVEGYSTTNAKNVLALATSSQLIDCSGSKINSSASFSDTVMHFSDSCF